MNIKGLPEGLDCIRIGRAEPDQYEVIGDTSPRGYHLERGARADSISQIVVVPATDYEIRQDIRTMWFYVVKKLSEPTVVTVSARFSVATDEDLSIVNDAIAKLQLLPGYVKEG